MALEPTKFSKKAFFKKLFADAFECLTVGFSLTMLLLGLLLCLWAYFSPGGRPSSAVGNVLGFGFQFSLALLFLFCGLFRSLKQIPSVSQTVYRLFHFFLSAVFFYVTFFPVRMHLSVALREMDEAKLVGDPPLNEVILGYTFFLIVYFSVIGIRAAVRASREKKARDLEEYESMLKKKKQK